MASKEAITCIIVVLLYVLLESTVFWRQTQKANGVYAYHFSCNPNYCNKESMRMNRPVKRFCSAPLFCSSCR